MRYVIILFLLLTSSGSFAQLVNTYQPQAIFQSAPYGTVTTLPPAPGEKIERVYLYPEWAVSDVFFKDSTKLADLSTKYNIKENEIEILYKQGDVRVLPVSRILSLIIKKNSGEKEEHINGSLLGPRSVFRDELLRVVYEGNVSLLCKTVATVIEGVNDPNPMLNAQKDDRVELKKKYIIAHSKGILMVEGSKSKFKSDITEVFGTEGGELAKKTNSKNETELVKLAMALEKLSQ